MATKKQKAPTKKREVPIYVADCETDPFEKGRVPVPFLWGVYNGANYEEFTQTADFVRYISQIECICYAHNGGKFDWHFITDFIEYGTDLMIINGRLASFKIGECEFRDSWNILPVPLAAMQKTEIDYAIFEVTERHKPHNWRAIASYLYDDCRFLFEYISAFVSRFGRHLTLAGCAMKTWQQMTGREAPKDEGGVLYDQFFPYYYGGRCQAFQVGIIEGDCALVDINSAYPRAMLESHPIGFEFDHITDPGELSDIGVVPGYAFVHCTGPSVGAFPYRGDDGGLWFPDDGTVREFYITGWEWNALLETRGQYGYVILEIWISTDLVDFSDFILPLYRERLECKAAGDKRGDLVAKLCMNSLYGKFASNPRNYCKYRVTDPERLPDRLARGQDAGDGWRFGGYFGELALLERDLPGYEERFYNICTSASITGYVRAFLWRSFRQCEGLLYCDTDSIIARDVSRLSTGKELGEWQIEAAFKGGGIGGKKLYAFEKYGGGWKTAAKGARLEHGAIIAICKGDAILYEPIAPTFSVHKAPTFVNRTLRKTDKKLIEKNPKKPRESLAKTIRVF